MVTDGGNLPNPGVKRGFTLVEVTLSLVIIALVFGGIINAYISASYRAEWTGYSLAAQAAAIQTLEQARSATWDTATKVDEIWGMVQNVSTMGNHDYASNTTTHVLSASINRTLDLPSQTNSTTATVSTTVTVSAKQVALPGSHGNMYVIQVDAKWPFQWKNSTNYYVNTLVTYMAPDNQDPNSL